MNILVTLDRNYVPPLTVMLKSLCTNQRGKKRVYVMSRDIRESELEKIRLRIGDPDLTLQLCAVDPALAEGAPHSRRHPLEIYYRLFAARYLPEEIDRILYLDPDLVVLKPFEELWELSMGENLYAAASHVGKMGEVLNSVRIVHYIGRNKPWKPHYRGVLDVIYNRYAAMLPKG